MTIQFTQINSPFFLAALLGLLLAFFIWSRRHILGATALVMLLLCVTWWAFGSAMQHSVQNPSAILFWFKFQATGFQFLAQSWLYFVMQYTGDFNRFTRRQRLLTGIPGTVAAILIWTNDSHLLFWRVPLTVDSLETLASFSAFGAGQWLATLFRYLFLLAATFLLVKETRVRRRHSPSTTLLLLACTLPAWVVDAYLLAFPNVQWSRGFIPLIYLVCSFLFIVALFRYRLLNIIPIAFETLIAEMSDVMLVLDTHAHILHFNPSAERILGVNLHEAVGQPAGSVLTKHPTLLPLCSQKQDESSYEVYLNTPDGKLYFEAVVTPIRDRWRNPMGQTIVLHNITKRVEAQNSLRLSQTLLERQALQLSMLNHIGEQIAAVMELDSILDNATHLIRSSFGYYHVALFLPDPAGDGLVMRSAAGAFASVFPPNHRLKPGQGIIGWVADNHNLLLANDVRKDPRYINFFPDRIVTRAELAVPVMLYDELVGVLDVQSPSLNGFTENDVRVLKSVADQIAVAIGNARLYEQLRMQLKEREKKENILRIQRDLVLSLSSFTQLDEMLQQAVRQLSAELRVPLVEIILLDPSGQHLVPAASLGVAETVPTLLPLDAGVVGWVFQNAQPALIPDVSAVPYYIQVSPDTCSEITAPLVKGEQVIGVINLESPQFNAFTQDDLNLLTILAGNLVVLIERARLFNEVERARAELERHAQDLELANERLRELDRLKSQFLANISHELRTPLNSIIGFSEVIYDGITGPINNDQREYLRYINESGQHLLELINDLLDFSRIESGHMQLEWSTFQMSDLLDEVRTIILPPIEKKGQEISIEVQADLPPITADRLRMRQVLINLLSNANKFTPDGGRITVVCRRELSPPVPAAECSSRTNGGVAPSSGCIHIAITDTGIGIKPEYQKLIFEEFRQVDGSLTREAAGTGLGLAISKRIVELHRGLIWVESEYGCGSTFHISLPVNGSPDMI